MVAKPDSRNRSEGGREISLRALLASRGQRNQPFEIQSPARDAPAARALEHSSREIGRPGPGIPIPSWWARTKAQTGDGAMATIGSLIPGHQSFQSHPTNVEGYVQILQDSSGQPLVHMSNRGSIAVSATRSGLLCSQKRRTVHPRALESLMLCTLRPRVRASLGPMGRVDFRCTPCDERPGQKQPSMNITIRRREYSVSARVRTVGAGRASTRYRSPAA
ncbi:hypothetical protein QE375_003197 [Microbacterium foliorum]|uniref:Uncharacterized protein n=1 Tax=Microbacterium foliorum TaxID=104336 RepID=A0ABU1HUC2_9MICO|nr:hypothetical protein [Microbacterium foliorum]